MIRVKKLSLTACFMLATILTFNCSNGNDDSFGGSFQEKSQLYVCDDDDCKKLKKFEGNGEIKLTVHCDTDNECPEEDFLMEAGYIRNGIVDLQLPTTKMHDSYLMSANEFFENGISNLSVSQNDVLLYGEEIFIFEGNDEYLNFGIINNDGYYVALYIYSSKAVKITGKDDETYVDLNLNAGFNIVYYLFKKDGTLHYTTNNAFTADSKWVIKEIGGGGGGDGSDSGSDIPSFLDTSDIVAIPTISTIQSLRDSVTITDIDGNIRIGEALGLNGEWPYSSDSLNLFVNMGNGDTLSFESHFCGISNCVKQTFKDGSSAEYPKSACDNLKNIDRPIEPGKEEPDVPSIKD